MPVFWLRFFLLTPSALNTYDDIVVLWFASERKFSIHLTVYAQD